MYRKGLKHMDHLRVFTHSSFIMNVRLWQFCCLYILVYAIIWMFFGIYNTIVLNTASVDVNRRMIQRIQVGYMSNLNIKSDQNMTVIQQWTCWFTVWSTQKDRLVIDHWVSSSWVNVWSDLIFCPVGHCLMLCPLGQIEQPWRESVFLVHLKILGWSFPLWVTLFFIWSQLLMPCWAVCLSLSKGAFYWVNDGCLQVNLNWACCPCCYACIQLWKKTLIYQSNIDIHMNIQSFAEDDVD